MNNASLFLSAIALVTAAGCYGDKTFVEDGAGGSPTSTSTSGGSPTTGGNGGDGNGGDGAEAPGGNGGEAPVGCMDPSDCPNASSDCVDVVCDRPRCGETNKDEGEGCAGDFGDGRCDGNGVCVECLSNTDCTPPATCDAKHQCVAPQCQNGSLDVGETDTDCGGTTCPPCENTDSCLVASDCTSGYCTVSLVCAPCALDSECDTVTEYCDGGSCAPKLPNGNGCLGNGACESANCAQTSAGGICCNSGCSGTCMSCAMVDTGQPNGTCANVTANTDPKNDCPTQPCRTGTCSAGGSCSISIPGSSCNDGIYCNGNDTCAPTGVCAHSGDPCADATPDSNCSDSCNEAADNCSADSPAGTPCSDGLFCTGNDICDGTGDCNPGNNPCTGPLCTDACNESTNLCNAMQTAGTTCNADMDLMFGTCSTSGACIND